MKKIVKLTESDLTRIVKRMIKEQDEEDMGFNNYIVSYTKDSGQTVDVSIGSNNLKGLIKKLMSFMSKNEFNSIFRIETGPMSF